MYVIDMAMKVKRPIDRVTRKRKFLRKTSVFPLFLLRVKKMGGVLEREVRIFGALIWGIFFIKYIYKIVFYGSLYVDCIIMITLQVVKTSMKYKTYT